METPVSSKTPSLTQATQATKDLEAFSVYLKLDEPIGDEEVHRNLGGTRELLRSTHNLTKFDLAFAYTCMEADDSTTITVAADLLLQNDFAKLRTLSLYMLRIPQQKLFVALNRCCNSLQTFELTYAVLPATRSGQWTVMLRYVRTMPQLYDLKLDHICERHDGSNTEVHVKRPEQPVVLQVKAKDRETVLSELDEVLAYGLVFLPFDLDW